MAPGLRMGQELALGDLAAAQNLTKSLQANQTVTNSKNALSIMNKQPPSLLGLLNGQGTQIDMLT